MEQVTRREGRLYYGERFCENADKAYRLFRADFNARAGRNSYGRLNKLQVRKERIHGFGFVFEDSYRAFLERKYGHLPRVKYRIAGLVRISYCRILDYWDLPAVQEEDIYEYLDWVFAKDSGVLRLFSRRDSTGRTSKRLKTKYR